LIEHAVEIKEYYVLGISGQLFIKEWVPDRVVNETPIILFHDSLGCSEMWYNFPELLAGLLSRRVISYDRFGFGQSEPNTVPALHTFIEDEVMGDFPAVKRHLGIKAYIAIGHSIGGVIGAHLAGIDEDCLSVITISSPPYVEEKTFQGIRDAKQFFSQSSAMDRLSKWHGNKAHWVVASWVDIWLSPAYSSWNLYDQLSRIKCPTLAIHGDNDEYGSLAFPECIASRVSGIGQYAILKNCGHVPHKEQPEALLREISVFMNAYNV